MNECFLQSIDGVNSGNAEKAEPFIDAYSGSRVRGVNCFAKCAQCSTTFGVNVTGRVALADIKLDCDTGVVANQRDAEGGDVVAEVQMHQVYRLLASQ